ncbi:MAG TPA: flagellar motor switch protein FliN [Betaproteobacteria bacterium]|nr:flagellar motor switch protein FliN [Betaproteobacteria bacterium]
MAEEETPEQKPEDDWAAAMAEEAAVKQQAEAPAEGQDADASAEDDWAAAMAEQTTAEPAAAEPAEAEPKVEPAKIFEELTPDGPQQVVPRNLDLIMDIPVNLTVELGRTKIAIRNLLQLAQGSVVELDGLAGEPMNVLVNGCLIAQGEVVVVNDKFGIRLTDIISPTERLRKLNR